jgi:hypothetical protein
VQRRVPIVILLLAVIAAAGLLLYVKRSRPASAAVVTTAAPAPRPAPAPSAPTTRPPERDARRPAPRRAPTPSSPAPTAAEPPAVSPDVATLRFTSDVPGTQVFLDRQFIGTAPVSAPNVTPGSHRMNASVEGFDGIAETIDVEPGPRDVPIRFRVVRLDAKIPVVHKHRFGSCTGALIATARELRYDTSNADDAFRVALADVESIDVDYLQKNLRVKVRKGKTYNFTDPAGNADHLFVFQRDVEKARQRLARGDEPAD